MPDHNKVRPADTMHEDKGLGNSPSVHSFGSMYLSLVILSESDCKTKIDYWLYNITNLETMKSSVPFQSQQPVFGRVGNIAELVRMTPQELKQYNISIDTYRSNLAVMKNERREGYEEGRTEGALLIARNLKQMGLSTSDVMKATGLTAAELSGI